MKLGEWLLKTTHKKNQPKILTPSREKSRIRRTAEVDIAVEEVMLLLRVHSDVWMDT